MGESLHQNGGLVDGGRKMRLSRNLCKMSSWLLICLAGDWEREASKKAPPTHLITFEAVRLAIDSYCCQRMDHIAITMEFLTTKIPAYRLVPESNREYAQHAQGISEAPHPLSFNAPRKSTSYSIFSSRLKSNTSLDRAKIWLTIAIIPLWSEKSR